MVDREHRNKAHGRVARVAIGGGVDVVWRFAARGHPLVAGLTTAGDMTVINHNR